jgi:hypothetical protein
MRKGSFDALHHVMLHYGLDWVVVRLRTPGGLLLGLIAARSIPVPSMGIVAQVALVSRLIMLSDQVSQARRLSASSDGGSCRDRLSLARHCNNRRRPPRFGLAPHRHESRIQPRNKSPLQGAWLVPQCSIGVALPGLDRWPISVHQRFLRRQSQFSEQLAHRSEAQLYSKPVRN